MVVIVKFGDRLVEVRKDVKVYDHLRYYCGCHTDEDLLEALARARWCLDRTKENPKEWTVLVTGDRSPKLDRRIRMLPFGWYDVLPEEVTRRAQENCWRLQVLGPQDFPSVTPDEASLYADVNCAAALMSIPVECCSLRTEEVKVETTAYVDPRKLRKIHLLFDYGKEVYGKKAACKNRLELFDTMMASGVAWSVEKKAEKIFLPVLEGPPGREKGRTLTTLSLKQGEDASHKAHHQSLLHKLLHLLSPESLKKVAKCMFPHVMDWTKSHEKEIANRVKAAVGEGERLGPGVVSKVAGELMCLLPEGLMFL